MTLIERTTERIETSILEEHGANSAYSAFMDLLNTVMDSKLKKNYSANKLSSKCRKMKCKKYLNE